jgi:HSP20 family protein
MTIVRWNPWQEINTLQRQFDRAFEDMLVPINMHYKNNFVRVPAAELKNTEDAILLKLEIPGMEAKDLDIQVTENTVAIRGERKSETKSDDKGVTRSEFHYGKFERVIPLPARIQNTNVKAEYKDGILNLNLPKSVAEKNKVVKVDLSETAA